MGLDLAGPLPVTKSGNRYVVALVEYVTKWVIAIPSPTREAKRIASIIINNVVCQHGPFREIMTDGAQELQSKVVRELIVELQAKQSTPVPYRPNLMGLVERYNRTWKDMVAMFVEENQRDWDDWVPLLAYAYNSAKNTVTKFTPFELMTGREARAPRDLLLRERVNDIPNLLEWHQKLRDKLSQTVKIARAAIEREQRRQARAYDRQQRHDHSFRVGELVWAYKPPRGPGITKLRHHWVGPCVIKDDVGYDNFRVERLDEGTMVIVHSSLLWPYTSNRDMLESIARDVVRESQRDVSPPPTDPDELREVTMVVRPAEGARAEVRRQEVTLHQGAQGLFFREDGRRRRQNKIGRYEVEVHVTLLSGKHTGAGLWLSLSAFESLWRDNKDIGDDVEAQVGRVTSVGS